MVVQQQFNNSARYAHYYEQEFEAKPEDHDGEAVVGGGREPDPGHGPANGEDEKAKLIAAVMEREAAEVITASGHSGLFSPILQRELKFSCLYSQKNEIFLNILSSQPSSFYICFQEVDAYGVCEKGSSFGSHNSLWIAQ